jgi:aspartate kinase
MNSELKVFKFGGASLKDSASFLNVADILIKNPARVVVLSASGKITDKLEQLIHAYFHKKLNHTEIWEEIKQYHYLLASSLFENNHAVFDTINDLLVEVEWILDEEPGDDFNYCYDQIIGIGELLSSSMMYALLKTRGINVTWMDARDFITTDDNYREGWVYWNETDSKCKKILLPALSEYQTIIVPGFIGSTADNTTVSLGREGSDYSAAIISYCVHATSLTIWKDIPGVYSADPKLFPDAVLLSSISYEEAIEMTYYGAKVIHLKTIKPLQSKNIPLIIKSFSHPENSGTILRNVKDVSYPPITIKEKNQRLLIIEPNDFSFISEKDLSFIYNVFHEIGFQVNFSQNTGIHLMVCGSCSFFDPAQVEHLLQPNYSVSIQSDCCLVSMRHYPLELKRQVLESHHHIAYGDVNGTLQIVYKEDKS